MCYNLEGAEDGYIITVIGRGSEFHLGSGWSFGSLTRVGGCTRVRVLLNK